MCDVVQKSAELHESKRVRWEHASWWSLKGGAGGHGSGLLYSISSIHHNREKVKAKQEKNRKKQNEWNLRDSPLKTSFEAQDKRGKRDGELRAERSTFANLSKGE